MYVSIGNYFQYHLLLLTTTILLLLAGDVSLNPGPSGSNERSKIATMNVRSIKPKTAPFSEYVTSKNLDIVAVTKTWLKHDETKSTIADISPPGYSFFHEPRAYQRAGGGVGILVSDQLKSDIHPLPSFKTFEAISARIGNNSFSGFVVWLYRLQNGRPTSQIFDEFQDLLESRISLHDNLYILGDFNLHLVTQVETPTNSMKSSHVSISSSMLIFRLMFMVIG